MFSGQGLELPTFPGSPGTLNFGKSEYLALGLLEWPAFGRHSDSGRWLAAPPLLVLVVPLPLLLPRLLLPLMTLIPLCLALQQPRCLQCVADGSLGPCFVFYGGYRQDMAPPCLALQQPRCLQCVADGSLGPCFGFYGGYRQNMAATPFPRVLLLAHVALQLQQPQLLPKSSSLHHQAPHMQL